MRIAEIYQSIQGEGRLTGTDSVFVRASGCNLRCWFCDTPFTSWQATGDDLAVDEVLRQVVQYDCSHAVVTGGEPMLFAELIPLCRALYLPVECGLMSISPKLANSTPSRADAPTWWERHNRTRSAPDVIRRLIDEYDYQCKFVVDQPSDCDEVERYLAMLPQIERSRVMLMPQGTDAQALTDTADWLVPLCCERGLTFCPRRHIELFGSARGT